MGVICVSNGRYLSFSTGNRLMSMREGIETYNREAPKFKGCWEQSWYFFLYFLWVLGRNIVGRICVWVLLRPRCDYNLSNVSRQDRPPPLDLNSGSVPAPSATCGMTCCGDRSEVCGSSRRTNCMLPSSAGWAELSYSFEGYISAIKELI